jgi:serine/threonine protein kinase
MRVSRLLHKHLFSSSSLEHIVAVRDVTTRPRMIELQNGLSANIHFIVSDFCEANLYEFCSHSLTRFFPRQELNAATYSEFLSQCNFLDSVARALFRHLVHAVLCLHEKGLYHCDIKLDNILVKRSVNSGELVLALGDFGRLSTTSAVFHSNPPVYVFFFFPFVVPSLQCRCFITHTHTHTQVRTTRSLETRSSFRCRTS